MGYVLNLERNKIQNYFDGMFERLEHCPEKF